MAEILTFLQKCVDNGDFPGAAFAVGGKGGLLESGCVGSMGTGLGAVTDETIYDLASLTKPICAIAFMQQLEEGLVCLDDRVDMYLDSFKGHPKGAITFYEILTHTAPLAGPLQLYRTCANQEEFFRGILYSADRELGATPVVYSSLGMILLGKIIEIIDGQPLDTVLERRIFGPLGMPDTMFNPPASVLDRIAPTEDCPWRGKIVRGQVHDENAVVLGGVCGHAGLFSTALDLARVAQAMLTGRAQKGQDLLQPQTIRVMTANHTRGMNLARGLGWQKKDPRLTPAGDLFTAESYGHTGFTGTCMWIDPKLDVYAVLLTNRVHPSRESSALTRDRHIFHNLAVLEYADKGWI